MGNYFYFDNYFDNILLSIPVKSFFKNLTVPIDFRHTFYFLDDADLMFHTLSTAVFCESLKSSMIMCIV